MFDQAIDTLTDALGDLGINLPGFEGGSDEFAKDGKIYSSALTQNISNDFADKLWLYKGSDWYKVFGYQFVVERGTTDSGGFFTKTNDSIYTLPIPPQSLNIRMIPATQATATMGGVVEETSENVFWLVSLAGTTGIAVSRQGTGEDKRHTMAKQFRDNVSTTGLLSGALGAVNSAISKFGGIADGVIDAVQSGSVAGVTGGLVGAFNTAFLPALPYAASGVDQETNGYTEMQEFHRFLYMYSILKSKAPSQFRLRFRCFKTQQEWSCIVQDFNIQQSAANPMLYRYNIALKCWDVGKPNSGDKASAEAFDRFGPDGDLGAVNLVNPQLFNTIDSEFGLGISGII